MAGISFSRARTITVAGFVADANPNATPPAAADVFALPDRAASAAGNKDVAGHSVYVRFLAADGSEVTTASADFRTWALDEGASAAAGAARQRFAGLSAEATVPSSNMVTSSLVGKLFVQVTALNTVGAAATAEVWIAARTSVPGA